MSYYKEKVITELVSVREFEPRNDYPWHRDSETRLIEVVECGKGWQIQQDNQLPKNLDLGSKIEIHEQVFHRLISGDGKLVLKITKII